MDLQHDTGDDPQKSSSHRRLGTSYFEGAHNLTLTNLNITNVQGNQYTTRLESGFAALHQQISHDAMFDSAVRYPAGRCHVGTREKIIGTILDWINDPTPTEPVLWLYGPAGVGKSAVMQTIAELLSKDHKEKDRYAGSFFFANGVVGRKEGSALFPTLAYQIAVNLPEIRPIIDKAMTHDLALPTKSIPIQLRHLILGPLTLSAQNQQSRHPPTVIIDGLDECEGSAIQCQILSCIADVISPGIPLRFLISSRPEYWLKDAFDFEPLRTSMRRVSLHIFDHETYLSAQSDIERFLVDGFESILSNNPRIMADVPRPWPSSDTIRSLVLQASGHFIHASTILKFVGNASDFCDPVAQLRIITDEDNVLRSVAFSDIDILYLKILSAYPRPESLKSVLAGLLFRMTAPSIERLLAVDSRELRIALDFLSSVLEPSDWGSSSGKRRILDDEDLAISYGHTASAKRQTFSHLSFQEFLQDSSRSGSFYIPLTEYRDEILTRFFQSVTDNLAGLPTLEEHRGFIYHDLYAIVEHETIFEPFCVLLKSLHGLLLAVSSPRPLSVSRPATLMRSLRCIEKYLLSLQSVGVNRDFFIAFLDNLRNRIYPKVVQHMLSSGSLKLSDNLIYTLGDHIGLKALSEMPGNSLERARSFLLHNVGIILTSESRIASLAPGFSTRSYNVMDTVRNVLEGDTFARLGGFGADYRRLNIEVCHRCLRYLTSIPEQNDVWDIVIEILRRFFDNPQISDIQQNEDMTDQVFLPTISAVLGHNWTRSDMIMDVQWQTLTMCLLQWSVRQTVRSVSVSMEALRRCTIDVYRQLLSFPRRMFEEILPACVAAILPFLPEILIRDSTNELWKLPECDHSPSHCLPAGANVSDLFIDLDSEGPNRVERIVDQIINFSGNSAPVYSLCLVETFLELLFDNWDGTRTLDSPSTYAHSSSSPIRAISKILTVLSVVRNPAIDN